MRILINLAEDKLAAFSKRCGEEFLPLRNGAAKGDAVVVVRGDSFPRDLELAVSLGVPVVVVAGTEDGTGTECVRMALSLGIPEECVLLKRKFSVATASGEEIGRALPRGIGLGSVVAACRRAVEKGMIPELLVWEENAGAEPTQNSPAAEDPVPVQTVSTDPVLVGPGEAGVEKPQAPSAAPDSHGLEAFVSLADQVILLFRFSNGGERDVRSFVEAHSGIHLELAREPSLYQAYGETFEEAISGGVYCFSNGEEVTAYPGYVGTRFLVVDARFDVPKPDALDFIHRRAARTFFLGGADVNEVEEAVEAFKANGWKLDAVVPVNPQAAQALQRHFRELFSPCLEDAFGQ